ncbi:hypothetical protein JNUCC1_00914 [Lentibacillus sp. JNUCC-1]|uniref:type II toxin-antitoxin system RelE/ParE family toxin n=1 Tax=Lentibacillus sp. JNUCC-1 TaxID=2654513 RepID=UPI0012E77FD6|nr:type II toxin-antitoxin system RelE/ParE family toxin [Lentibacillus sp. JNUCC-1]MUV37108.1 hypothetical protein [Lentibacillus sp. JNUCC-1]
MYKIKYLPIAKKDLLEITRYIKDELHDSLAAMNLIDAFDASISRLQEFPYSCKVYQTTAPLDTEYRVLPVKKYLVFYTVLEHQVEIHRVIYAKMDLNKLIK